MNEITPVIAKARLAVSRAELLAAMGFEEAKNVQGTAEDRDAVERFVEVPKARRRSATHAFSAKVSHSAIGRWWRNQPMSSVFQLSEPLLESYARRQPARLVAWGAGAGALVYLVKPWKLLSEATVIGFVVKSSYVSGMISDVFKTINSSDDDKRFPALPGRSRDLF